MARTKEEIQSALVWRLVEEVRQLPPGSPPLHFDRDEIAELGELLNAAAAAAPALETPTDPARVRAVRDHLAEQWRSPAPAAATEPARGWLPLSGHRRLPVWQWYSAVSALAAVTLALVYTAWIRRPETIVRTVRVPVSIQDQEFLPINEEEAEALLPQMVRNQLDRRHERSLMWHMLVCPGCYDKYVELRHQRPLARRPAAARSRYPW